MAQPIVRVHTDGRLLVFDEGRTFHVNIAGPGVCTCGVHRPGAPCRHVYFVRRRMRHHAGERRGA